MNKPLFAVSWKLLPLLLLLLGPLVFWSLGLDAYLSFAALQSHHQLLSGYVEQHFFLSILLYLLSYSLIVSFSIPGATFMTILGGFLFSAPLGTLFVVLAACLGVSVIFFAASFFAKSLQPEKMGETLQKMRQGFQQNAFFYLLSLRLIPLFPFFLVNLTPAFFPMRFRVYLGATLLGILPATFIYASLGALAKDLIERPDFSWSKLLDLELWLVFLGLGLLALLPAFYRSYQQKKNRPS